MNRGTIRIKKETEKRNLRKETSEVKGKRIKREE